MTSTGEPRDLAALGRKVYVGADGRFLNGIVSRYDAVSGVREDGIELLACAMASGEGVLWAAGCPSVQRLSTGDGRLRKLADVFLPFQQPERVETARAQLRELAVGAGSVWVLGDALDRRMWRLDARTGAQQAVLDLGFPPTSLAVAAGRVWITDGVGDRVVPIDIERGVALPAVPVGRGPSGIAAGAGGALGGQHARSHRFPSGSGDGARGGDDRDGERAARHRGRARRGLGDGACVLSCAAVSPARAYSPRSRRRVAGCGGTEPMRIGLVVDCMGVQRPLKAAEESGAQLPLLERGGRRDGDGLATATVAGRPVELVPACTESLGYSILTRELRRLAEDEHVDAVVAAATGPDEIVLRDVARTHPGVSFVALAHGPREVTLQDPAPNLYRFVADYGQGVAGLATYAYDTLGWRRAAIVDAAWVIGWPHRDAFAAEFCALGGGVTDQIGIPVLDPAGRDAERVPTRPTASRSSRRASPGRSASCGGSAPGSAIRRIGSSWARA